MVVLESSALGQKNRLTLLIVFPSARCSQVDSELQKGLSIFRGCFSSSPWLHSCLIGMCNGSTCRHHWLSFPLAHSHTESTVSVSEQVLAWILKPYAYHLNLVLLCHLGAISGWYFGSMPLYLLQLNSYPQLLNLLRFTLAWLSGQRYSSVKPTLVVHSLLPLLSPHACFQLTVHPTSIWWGGNRILCAFCKERFMQMGKNQPQLRPEQGQSTHGYNHPWSISQQGPIQATCDHCADG